MLEGSSEIYTVVAKVTNQVGNVAEKQVSFSVFASFASMRKLIEQEYGAGRLEHSLYKQLQNSLDQSEHHMNQLRKHLDKAGPQSIPADVRKAGAPVGYDKRELRQVAAVAAVTCRCLAVAAAAGWIIEWAGGFQKPASVFCESSCERINWISPRTGRALDTT